MRKFKVRSQTDRTIIYEVTEFEDGIMMCSCPIFNKKLVNRMQDCKHIKLVKQNLINK